LAFSQAPIGRLAFPVCQTQFVPTGPVAGPLLLFYCKGCAARGLSPQPFLVTWVITPLGCYDSGGRFGSRFSYPNTQGGTHELVSLYRLLFRRRVFSSIPFRISPTVCQAMRFSKPIRLACRAEDFLQRGSTYCGVFLICWSAIYCCAEWGPSVCGIRAMSLLQESCAAHGAECWLRRSREGLRSPIASKVSTATEFREFSFRNIDFLET